MATQPNLETHDVLITERSTLGLNGTAQRVTRVTYFVGTHGPFTAEFPTAEFTPAAVKAVMDKQVAILRAIVA